MNKMYIRQFNEKIGNFELLAMVLYIDDIPEMCRFLAIHPRDNINNKVDELVTIAQDDSGQQSKKEQLQDLIKQLNEAFTDGTRIVLS